MNGTKTFYLIMMIAGTIIPWYFFTGFIAANGAGLGNFIGAMYANGASSGGFSDLLLSTAVFWVWSFVDARKHGVANWWLVVPATLAVGLSLAMPLYLWKRAGARQEGLAQAL